MEGYAAWHTQAGVVFVVENQCGQPATGRRLPIRADPYRTEPCFVAFVRFLSLSFAFFFPPSPSLSFLVFFLLALASHRRLSIHQQASKQARPSPTRLDSTLLS